MDEETFRKLYSVIAASQALAQLPKEAWNPSPRTPEQKAYSIARREWEKKRNGLLEILAEEINNYYGIHLSLSHDDYGDPIFNIPQEDEELWAGPRPRWEDFKPCAPS